MSMGFWLLVILGTAAMITSPLLLRRALVNAQGGHKVLLILLSVLLFVVGFAFLVLLGWRYEDWASLMRDLRYPFKRL